MPYFIAFSAVTFIFGTVIGSFLNVVIYRTPLKEQVVKGRSHCMFCGHTLAWYDLFPVLSQIFLRGKCRYCGAKISPRYALVELLCGTAFLCAFLALGITLEFAFALVLFPVLICLSFFDIDSGEIEYWCPLTVAALGLIALVLSLFGVTGGSWSEMLIGAVVISVPFAALSLFGAMGGADVQLMAAAGLLLGWKIIPAALIGIVLGSVFGIVYKIGNKSENSEEPDLSGEEAAVSEDSPTEEEAAVSEDLPTEGEAAVSEDLPIKGTVMRFAPFLAVGIAAAYLCGDFMIQWYLGFLS
ncbi:MAG: prepilin peptidase [Oscillospiraceae bacterium]|jgi:leader peptidase (prepilin peptidase)/N-methyltransferase|nr:prepilin peptidase [Oscillospiraceae bacterium]